MRSVFIDFGFFSAGFYVFACRGKFGQERRFFVSFKFLLVFLFIRIAILILRFRLFLSIQRVRIRFTRLRFDSFSPESFRNFFLCFPHPLQPGSLCPPAQVHKSVYP